MSILSVRNLTKKYSETCTAVNNVTFTCNQGEILGILGANGAGKTTTIHMLLSLLQPTSGSITYFGKNFFSHRSEILQDVGFGTAYARLPGNLTVTTNLDIYGRLYGLTASERNKRIKQLLTKLDVLHLHDRKAGGLSAGETTRIILAKAFLARPKMVLLDEPTASLDVDVAQTIRAFIAEQRDQGVSFIFTSHNMHEMTHLCNRIIVMQKGNIINNSTPEELAQKVSRSFLQLLVGTHYLKQAIAYAQANKITYTTDKVSITLEVDEHQVAQTLMDFAQKNIPYREITIKKPTLEDYFLSLSSSEEQS